jgi:hypothetical protein
MRAMDSEMHAHGAGSSIEEVVLELEWAVHEAARKRLAGKPADQEFADIGRLVDIQVCLAISDKKQRENANTP